MNNRTTMSSCYKSLKQFGVNYFNELLSFYDVKYDIRKLSMTEIASFLTNYEKTILSKHENKWTFALFLRCVERFIKSKKESQAVQKNKTFRNSNSVYKIKYTGMKN